jgi:YidC/Oxa1 family membrane protein insertase
VSILNPLFYAIAWVIMRIHAVLGDIFGPSSGWAWGLSIVFLVIFLRLLMLPLFIKQFHSQRKMMAVAPQLQELRKRYKNDKQRLNEETMKFYKENGVNPLGGCLPMIAQFPVFISLFEVLKEIAQWKTGGSLKYGLTEPVVNSALHAHIFGALLSDTVLFHHPTPPFSQRAVILVAVLISMTTTFITMRQTTKRGLMNATPDPDNPMAQSQKYMMYIAPFFALTGLYWQFGLVIYWVTNNLWTMSQQFFMYRNMPVGGVAAAVAAAPSTTKTTVVKSGTAARTTRSGTTTRPGTTTRSGTTTRTGTKTGTAARTGSAKTGTTSKARTTTKTGTSSKTRTPATTETDATTEQDTDPKNGTAPKNATAAKNGSSSKSASSSGPKTGNAKTDAMANGKTGGARGLLRVGRKAEPEPEPEPEPETKIVRQQPVRQTRSKRSGRR